MSADPGYVAGCDVAVVPAGQPLPEPWYRADRRSLECDLCRDAVDALWLLSPHRPPDLGRALPTANCASAGAAPKPSDPSRKPTSQPAA
jgi:hypothetical protein